MGCNIYIPYTVSELQEKIKNVLDKIEEYSGVSDSERIRNGTDEYESGDVLKNLQKEYSLWQNMLNEKLRQEGQCSQPSNFKSKLYGCL